MVVKKLFIRWFPKVFVLTAHIGGAAICLWMERWDLLIAGIAFGIPSTLLFMDLMPGGRGVMIKVVKKLL